MSANNFGVRGSNLTKLFHVMSHEAGMAICVQLSGEDRLREIWEGKNVKKIRHRQNSRYFRCPIWKTKSWQKTNLHENWNMQTLSWSILNISAKFH